jgi:Fic family protein
LDLRKLPHPLWALLGETRSKFEHIAGTPLRPETAEQLHLLYLAKGALATTAIEGNTLSEEEVRRHLDGELELPESREYLKKEIDNIVAACNSIAGDIFEGTIEPISPEVICAFNDMVLDGLELEPGVVPGEVRKTSVGVARYRGAPADDCGYLLEQLCDWLNASEFTVVDREFAHIFAVIRAVVAHVYVAWIHPFGDGNGRTARLLEFRILVGSGIPTPAAHLLSNHYNLTRTGYYHQLDTASRSGGDIIPFLEYAVRGLIDGLREQLGIVRAKHMEEIWTNFVHDQFRDKTSPADQRKRHLVLDLSKAVGHVPRTQLRHLSPRLAEAYAGRTPKTLSRDINDLMKMELIGRSPAGYFVRSDRIMAFPPRAADGLL